MCRSTENPAVSPGSATRLSTSARRAGVACSAATSSGTRTCGMTLVNHEPGPSTTRSALMIASTAWRVAGGSLGQQPHPPDLSRRGGDRHLAADHPAHPRIRFQPCDIGFDLQRDRAHRQHPALDAEYPAQFIKRRNGIGENLVEPGHQAGCRWDGRPAHRCRRTCVEVIVAHSRPCGLSDAKAASAIRRSPGGTTSSSLRSRPDEPPSSATVTTAVTCGVSLRAADNVA